MICRFCSQWNPDDARSCSFCGNDREAQEDATLGARKHTILPGVSSGSSGSAVTAGKSSSVTALRVLEDQQKAIKIGPFTVGLRTLGSIAAIVLVMTLAILRQFACN